MFGLRKTKRDKSKGAKNRGQKAVRPIRVGTTPRQLFHGVAVKPGESDACAAIKDLAQTRFLADEAPMLPLAGCTNPAGCNCTYQHFEDRRTQPRRESDIGLPLKDHPEDGRRGHGRRVTDG